MRLGASFFLVVAANLCCIPGAGLAMADTAFPGQGAGASPIDGKPGAGEAMDAPSKAQGWRLVRRGGPHAEWSAAAILHTADVERSDSRLAGLMLRCGGQGQGLDAILVVVEPFPPHARPQITLRAAGQEARFVGTIIPTGAGVRLPSDATSLVTGSWRMVEELDIKIADGDTAINGAVSLGGLSGALDLLNAECVQK